VEYLAFYVYKVEGMKDLPVRACFNVKWNEMRSYRTRGRPKTLTGISPLSPI